jgi:hypothetical protein
MSSTATSTTASSTSSSGVTASPTPATDCPASNSTLYKSKFLEGANGPVGSNAQLVFRKICGAHFANQNVAQSYVYSFDDCIELCASLNFWANNGQCIGATYRADGGQPGNCWAHGPGATREIGGPQNSAILS